MRRLSLLVMLALLGAGCGAGGAAAPTPQEASATGATGSSSPATPGLFGASTASIETERGVVTFEVEIAVTDDAHQQGLMGRTEMAEDAGMIFVFPDEQVRAFWMKDTLIPLSIAFYDADGVIVSIKDMEPCDQPSCPLYSSDVPAVGALEVNAGAFERAGVAVGDRVTVEPGG